LCDGSKSQIAGDCNDSGMPECVAHSRASARQRIAREAFIETLNFAARVQLGQDCETLLRYFGQLQLRYAPTLNLTSSASNADEDDADED
jgi:hypothetical protein